MNVTQCLLILIGPGIYIWTYSLLFLNRYCKNGRWAGNPCNCVAETAWNKPGDSIEEKGNIHNFETKCGCSINIFRCVPYLKLKEGDFKEGKHLLL